ncbi:MAG: roadblock/LC7 domain-containing protein [Gemmatimonadetes bacterium]|nr:roadblock/LC7 domain-containing protein [Gemmatimonadota bacterium]
MPTIRDLVANLAARPGVDAAVLLGRDGLLIDGAGADGAGLEAAAAYVPSLIAAAEELSSAVGSGRLVSKVMEFERGYAVISALSPEALLLVLVSSANDLGPIVGDIRRHRSHIASIL